MKTSSDNNKLDNFLSTSLKNLDIHYRQSDWGEMEPLLGSVHKPISVNVSQRTVLISLSVLVIVTVGIIISQTVDFSSSPSEELAPANTDSSQSLLHGVTTPDTITVHALAPSIDSARSDSVLPEKENKKIDSVKVIVLADTASKKKDDKKQDKKEKVKQNIPVTDTSSGKTVIQATPPADSTFRQEIKIDTTGAPKDSTKSAPAPKKSKKGKKTTSAPADSTKAKTETLPPAKPDSAKQQ